MTSTAGVSAGLEANDIVLSYANESSYGVPPAVPSRVLRIMSEGLTSTKNRARPNEIQQSGEASQAVTQSQMAAGPINGALSSTTYDDLMASTMGADWLPDSAKTGTTVAATAANTFTSATANYFQGIQPGKMIRVEGFSNPANNGYFSVVNNTGTVLTVAGGTTVAEAAGPTVRIRGSMLRNAADEKTLFIQKLLGPGKFLQYPGSLVNSFNFTFGQGDFPTIAAQIMAKGEVKPAVQADFGTGAQIAAPTGPVHNTVSGFLAPRWNDVDMTPDGAIVGIVLNLNRAGAAQDFGMGSPLAAGMRTGTLEAGGTFRRFFNTWTDYDRAAAEATGKLQWGSIDANGAGYWFTLHRATYLNPQLVAGGRDQPCIVEYTLEGNPGGFSTVQIDRFGAAGV